MQRESADCSAGAGNGFWSGGSPLPKYKSAIRREHAIGFAKACQIFGTTPTHFQNTKAPYGVSTRSDLPKFVTFFGITMAFFKYANRYDIMDAT
jgi:hypothetical protein